jgi:hypothetical protein
MPRPQTPTYQQLTPAKKPKSWQQQRKEWLRGKTFGVAKASRADNRVRQEKAQRKISSQQPRNKICLLSLTESSNSTDADQQNAPEDRSVVTPSNPPVEDLEEASDSSHSDEELSILDTAYLENYSTLGNPQVSIGPREYLVTVVNGTGEFKYKIEVYVLETSSSSFRAARSTHWTKPDVPTVVHGRPLLFHMYLSFVHGETWRRQTLIDGIVEECNTAPPVDGEIAPAEVLQLRKAAFETFIGIYILADQFLNPVSANAVIDQMIQFSNATGLVPHLEAINLACDSTPENSPLRMLLRDGFIHEASVTTMEEIMANGPHADFLVDIALENCKLKSFNKKGTIKKWFYQEAANRPDGYYHQHVPESTVTPAQPVPNWSYELVGIVLSE